MHCPSASIVKMCRRCPPVHHDYDDDKIHGYNDYQNSTAQLYCTVTVRGCCVTIRQATVMACLHGAIVAAIGRATDRRDDRTV